ncbi:hypothetical protein J4E05_02875 [Thalassospira sp. NFXS8]|uniref:SGNH/GDSL hydrolase family protein n=1 Tax=Thalassospira sp. NFXS8 TaxID=2819093 RepID=UPI0032DE5253
MKKIISVLVFLAFLFFSFDGFLDFISYVKPGLTNYFAGVKKLKSLPVDVDRKNVSQAFDDVNGIKYSMMRVVGKLPLPGDYGSYKIGARGDREIEYYNDQNIENNLKRILILGSSQSFGYFSGPVDNFANQLAMELPEYRISNFSVPGQMIAETKANWQRISLLGKKYDKVIIIEGPIDFYNYCTPGFNLSSREVHRMAVMKLIDKASRVYSVLSGDQDKYQSPCLDESYKNILIKNVFSDFKGIIEYGRDIGSETYIVVPPSPYVGNVNVENLSKNNLAFRRLVTELGVDLEKEYQDIPQVIDMKNIFSGTGPMFLDWGGHFTPKGNKVFAHSVANFVKSTDYN